MLLTRCDGGFFHTPTAGDVGGPGGETVFVRVYSGREIVGMGTGVRRGCRLAESPRHFYFPTLPAVAPGVNPGPVLDSLIDGLRCMDAAELEIASFDARWNADTAVPPQVLRAREEYVMPLQPAPESMFEALATGHRRQIRKADRSGWRIDVPDAPTARSVLTSVQELAAKRASERGNGFQVRIPRLDGLESAGQRPWGATVFVAMREATPLAAALVGWANRRAFYVMGGSTAAGYECGASVWLHWKIACRLAEAGFQSYNLGGASATAASPGSPAHGLYRFKMGFGASVINCRSASWILSAAHERLHQIGRWLSQTTSYPAQTT